MRSPRLGNGSSRVERKPRKSALVVDEEQMENFRREVRQEVAMGLLAMAIQEETADERAGLLQGREAAENGGRSNEVATEL